MKRSTEIPLAQIAYKAKWGDDLGWEDLNEFARQTWGRVAAAVEAEVLRRLVERHSMPGESINV